MKDCGNGGRSIVAIIGTRPLALGSIMALFIVGQSALLAGSRSRARRWMTELCLTFWTQPKSKLVYKPKDPRRMSQLTPEQEATAAYVDDLEKRVAFLEALLDEARGLIPNDYDDERKLRSKIDKALE